MTGSETRTRALRVAVEEAAGEAKSTVVERLLEALRALHASADAVRGERAALRDLAADLETKRRDQTLERRAAKLCLSLEESFTAMEESRARFLSLMDRHVPETKRDALRSAVIPRPDRSGAALRALLLEFRGGFVSRLAGQGVIAKSVKGITPRVLLAAAALYEEPHCSVDPVGASNVEHMVSVFECVLGSARAKNGKALKSTEVDQLFLDTIATDIRGKGRSSLELADFATVPMQTLKGRSIGDTGSELWSRALMRDLDAHWPKSQPKSATVKRALKRVIKTRVRPSSDDIKSDLRTATRENKLTAGEAKLGRAVWRAAMEKAPFPSSVYLRDFQAGTLMHGIGHLDDIVALVVRAGGTKASSKRVAECQLGHHMAGFVAYGFSEIDSIPDFETLASQGYIRSTTAVRLEALYREAIGLAKRWRPNLDEASRSGGAPSLTHRQRALYARDATALRKAVARLPEPVRWQLLNDDAGQFTPVGLPKWLTMFRGMPPAPANTGELVRAVYNRAHQPYKEENEARGSGEAFEASSAEAAKRLGLVLVGNELEIDSSVVLGEAKAKAVEAAAAAIREHASAVPDGADRDIIEWFAERPSSHFREATPSEPAYASLAVRLRHDVWVRRQHRDESGGAKATDEAMVEWFRASSPDPAMAARIAQVPAE